MLEALSCPACTAPGLDSLEEATFRCNYCGVQLLASKIDCPACGYRNHAGADLCENCGEPLSIVAGILDRQGSVGRPLWIRRLQTQITKLKTTEAEASRTRMAELEEIDRKRMQAETEARLIQQEKDRRIMFYGALGVLGFLLIVMIIYALSIVFA